MSCRFLSCQPLAVLLVTTLGLLLSIAPNASAQPVAGALTSRPRPTVAPATALTAGTEIRTGAGERRRLALADGATIYVNERSVARLENDKLLSLTAGEVYVEAANRLAVRTGKGVITGKDAHFAVRLDKAGPAVAVTRGSVSAEGLGCRALQAGQHLAAGAATPTAAQRASHTLGWLHDVMCAAEAPLLPANEHAGGALVAIDPNGQEAHLGLRRFHLDVHIEDGFARTTIDQTYFNHHSSQLEGTFYFPLPPDASLSRLAMYVNGQLMEGGMAERDHARTVYETIRYARRDPALLEWVDGSTFKMRVFPLEPRQEKRIILSYGQRLPALYGQMSYRFPAGHRLQQVRDWSVQVHVKDGQGWAWDCPSHKLSPHDDPKDLLLRDSARDAAANRDLVLTVADPRHADPADEVVQFATAEHEGARYLMARVRPRLLGKLAAQRRDWVFLVETSGDRDPLLARTQIEILRHLLSYAEPDDTFTVLAAGTRVKALSKEPLSVTPEHVNAAIAFLESAHLIGALDLGQALSEAAAYLKQGNAPHLVHLGSGIAAMGERRDDVLARRLPEGASYIGIGVGKRWNRGLMKLAAERTGGHFTQINPDEPAGWRAFDLLATINTPRLMHAQISDPAGKAKFLALSEMIAQGEELVAIARLDAKEPLPKAIELSGAAPGMYTRMIPVTNVKPGADYLPRTWAKLEIDRLLAEDAVKHKDAIVALSKAMYVITPFTSLLVLENEDQYTQYRVDRGRKDHWALYSLPEKVSVVIEPDPDAIEAKAGKRPVYQVLQTLAHPSASEADKDDGKERPSHVFQPYFGQGRLALQDGLSPYFASDGKGINYFLGTPPVEATRSMANFSNRATDAAPITGVGFISRQPKFAAKVLPLKEFASGGFVSTAFQLNYGMLGAPRKRVEEAGPSMHFAAQNTPTVPQKAAPGFIGGAFAMPEQRHHEILARMYKARELAPENVTATAYIMMANIRTEQARHVDPDGTMSGIPTYFNLLIPLPCYEFQSQMVTVKLNADDEFLAVLSKVAGMPTFLPNYKLPTYVPPAEVFHDLVSYAPGLNTTAADVLAVLDAEALPGAWNKPGKVDPAARDLLEKIRLTGWHSLTLPADGGVPGYRIHFDGTGRFVYERVLPFGLRERVVCDGKTLTHLYPQLALAAQRDVSRFHRADLAALVPWILPPADELARGADVQLASERTVSIVPHGERGQVLHLVFANDGRVAERRLVELPSGKIVARLTLAGDGTARLLDGKGNELSVRQGKLSATSAPELAADTKDLLVLPIPYRTPEHVRSALKLDKRANADLSLKEALPLFLAYVAQGNANEAQQLFQQVFHACEQRQLGYYVLLASCGVNLDSDHGNILAEHLDSPLAQYLALHTSPVLRKHAAQWAVGSASWQDGFLQHLAVTHAMLQRWQEGKVLKGDPTRAAAETRRAIDYVKKNRDSMFGWALLGLIQDRAENDGVLHGQLAELWPLFEDQPALRFAARYETARSLWKTGKKDAARQRFQGLYESAVKDGMLPAVDADLRQALLADDGWGTLMRQTARRLVESKRRVAVLALARQCWDLDDQPLAGELLGTALDGIADPTERAALSLAAFGFLRDTAQLAEADRLLQGLLGDPKLARHSLLRRLGHELAKQRDMPARAVECLEQALALEAEQPPEVIDLEALRTDYGAVLEHYQNLAEAMVALKAAPPADFRSRVVRAADRWRAVDHDPAAACQAAAKVLKRLGDRELAWDYLTTPVGLRPNESGPWWSLALALGKEGALELADRAYRAAADAEPTDAQIIWERAQNLKLLGKHQEAQQLVRRIAEGTWQPRFQGLQAQARHLLGKE
jgi:ferric-dicitrate binding protein FerR (iron transport regulator)